MTVQTYDCEVLIAGGGPVGLALACELGRRGVECIVLDPKPGFHEHPRATTISPRSMEYFSTWGIADEVLQKAVAPGYPMDVVFAETIAGVELGRLRYPTIRQMKDRTARDLATFPQLSWSRYGKVCIGQNNLEPILGKHAANQRYVRHMHLHELVSFKQDDQSVIASVRAPDGTDKVIRSSFLVGCEGARSVTRNGIGATLEGQGDLGRSVNTFFRAPGLLSSIGKSPGFLMWSLTPGATGAIIAIDGEQTWVFSRHLSPGEAFDDTEDPRIAIQAAVGKPIDIDVVSSWSWVPRQLLATKYTDRRVMLVGDSAHLMSPTGGYGLNTGIADAMNLGWKLDAILSGWGGAHLLKTYQDERRPLALRCSNEATDNRIFMREVFSAGSRLSDSSEERQKAIEFIQLSMPKHGKHFDAMGIYLGERYDKSPLTVPDGGLIPPWDAEQYYPSACPGGRLPLSFTSGGQTLQELCGMDFTLLSTRPAKLEPLLNEFAKKRVPIATVPLDIAQEGVLDAPHLLVRPDGIVAWRSKQAPSNPEAIVDALRGAKAEQFPADGE